MGIASGAWLTLRSVLWALLLPGLVAGYVPWRYFGIGSVTLDLADPLQWIGLLAIGLGVALLITAIFEFARTGRGTLSPVDPPRKLVVRGLYRYVRNPMYLSVSLIALGEALLARSTDLLLYWATFFAAANLYVMGYEEPNLKRRFGADYDRYRNAVGRWIPRLTPYHKDT
jgi:protein-S-isoprenylcysteine O-methyltransferase Ste14